MTFLDQPLLDGNMLEDDELSEMINPVIYARGVTNENFYLILDGKVSVCSGNEGFLLEQGPFNYMGTECLTNDYYKPDFSAKVIGKAKLLKINKEAYRKAVSQYSNH